MSVLSEGDYGNLHVRRLRQRTMCIRDSIQDRVGHVFIVTEGRARQQPVKVGLTWGEKISILEGVTDSTPVIVNGHRQLVDGTEISVVK